MNALEKTDAPEWDAQKTKLLKDTICKGADDNEFQLAMQVVERTGLNPFAGQIHFIKRWNSQLGREEMKPQVGIDGFRLIAHRTKKYAGQLGPMWCGADGVWKDVWLESNPPAAAKVGVLHVDFKEPLWAVARFSTYLQTTKTGAPKGLWQKGGDLMISKCAEALALRKAFPQELSALYTEDEAAAMEERDVTPRADVSEAQAKFERERGIAPEAAKPVEAEVVQPEPAPTPAEKTPEQLATEEAGRIRKARKDRLPKDVIDYFKAKKFTAGRAFEIMDVNEDDPEKLRGFMRDNPVEVIPEKLEDLNESLPTAEHHEHGT